MKRRVRRVRRRKKTSSSHVSLIASQIQTITPLFHFFTDKANTVHERTTSRPSPKTFKEAADHTQRLVTDLQVEDKNL